MCGGEEEGDLCGAGLLSQSLPALLFLNEDIGIHACHELLFMADGQGFMMFSLFTPSLQLLHGL